MSRHRLSFCLVLLLSTRPAAGQTIGTMKIVTSSDISPQIRYGSAITYTVQGAPSSGVIKSTTWQYQASCSPGWSNPYSTTGSGTSVMYTEIYVGNQVVKADVTVRDGYNDVVIPVTINVTILPPDDIKLPDPPNDTATLPYNAYAKFVFPIMCAKEQVGNAGG